ncbi:MAG TPA: hypothetical protein VGQ49_05620 [Bryobacteraceae bacterium]|nr:hypothetical protein [Bryobacteraceae bacterium]
MTILLTLSLISVSAHGQSRIVKLNGGLEAEILTLGRDTLGYNLTTSLRISNKGKSTAYLLLIGNPVATDNTGGVFNNVDNLSGIASCRNVDYGLCIGAPKVVEGLTVPLQGYTQIDPDVEITINLRLNGSGSKGPLVSLSANVAYRLVSDSLKDETLSDLDKRKQLKLMSLSFPATSVTEAK